LLLQFELLQIELLQKHGGAPAAEQPQATGNKLAVVTRVDDLFATIKTFCRHVVTQMFLAASLIDRETALRQCIV